MGKIWVSPLILCLLISFLRHIGSYPAAVLQDFGPLLKGHICWQVTWGQMSIGPKFEPHFTSFLAIWPQFLHWHCCSTWIWTLLGPLFGSIGFTDTIFLISFSCSFIWCITWPNPSTACRCRRTWTPCWCRRTRTPPWSTGYPNFANLILQRAIHL